MARFKLKGLAEFQRSMKKLERKLEAVDGVHNVPIDEILTPTFMTRFTNFGSIEEMFEESDYSIQTSADLEQVPQTEWDQYVNRNTQFATWSEMLERAGQDWFKNRLDAEI